MKAVFSLLCQTAIVDRETGNLSLVNIVEEVSAQPPEDVEIGDLVALPSPLRLVTVWIRDNEEVPESGKHRLRILGPEGKLARHQPANEVDITLQAHLRFRLIAGVEALPWLGPGLYRFVSEALEGDQWVRKFETPLTVKQTEDGDEEDEQGQEQG